MCCIGWKELAYTRLQVKRRAAPPPAFYNICVLIPSWFGVKACNIILAAAYPLTKGNNLCFSKSCLIHVFSLKLIDFSIFKLSEF